MPKRPRPDANKLLDALKVPTLDWEDTRAFLETARQGSFTAAAARLGMSINSVRRRVTNLERSVSCPLLTRGPEGIRLTAQGIQFLAMAKKMEDGALDLLLAAAGMNPSDQVGTVRVSTQDAIGPLWIAPRLSDYRARHPDMIVELLSAPSAEVAELDADITIQIGRAPGPEFEVVRLGRTHSVPTVSEKFLSAHDMPRTLEQLRAHPLLLLDRPQSLQIYGKVFSGDAQEELVRLRTNDSMVQLLAVLNGGGFAWMPTFVHAVVSALRVVPIGEVFSSDIWLTRRAGKGGPRAENVWIWMLENFDCAKFPWFDDDYIPPSRFSGRAQVLDLRGARYGA